MNLIVGLGNPGKKYEQTRHNVGFLAVEHFLLGKEQISCRHQFQGELCELSFIAENTNEKPLKVLFLKPQTYMNNSGRAVSEAVRFYKVNIETDLLVIHDEVDLALGSVKLSFDSRPAGHNGIKSIIDHLGTQKFHRLRIGIESRISRQERTTETFVLENFNKEETTKLQGEILPKTDKEIEKFLLK